MIDENTGNAVSIYSQDSGSDDFPVLKAFQQYIDAEQAKARKRMVSMGIFFMVLTGAVIAVFVALLVGMSNRNQQLNDRILEYVMRDRERPAASAPVVVQPPPAQDNSALMALTAKLEAMERKMSENRESDERAAAREAKEERMAAERAVALERIRAEESRRTAELREELETLKLKARLAAEREKLAAEKERRREAELEAYRRKHYPELYEKKKKADPLDDDAAIDYFSGYEDEDRPAEKKRPAASAVKKDPKPPELGVWHLPE